MDIPNPSAGAGAARPENSGRSAGFEPAAFPDFPIPVEVRAVGQSSVPWTVTGEGAAAAAQTISSIVPGGPGTAALPVFSVDLFPAVEGSSADPHPRDGRFRPSFQSEAYPFWPCPNPRRPSRVRRGTAATPLEATVTHRAGSLSETTATATTLEESTIRLASGLEFMNLTGGELPAVEGPSISTRKRTPGKWRRIPRPKRTTEYLWRPRDHSPDVKAMMDKWDLCTWENIEQIKNMSEKDCDIFTVEDRLDFHAFKKKMVPALERIANSKPENTFLTPKTFSDTKEEHLTAEGMEAQILAQFPDRQPCQQAKYFAELALAHYNEKKKHKFTLATTLLSNCFSESSGTTYGHVNFTGILQKTATQSTSSTKRLFFAEVMLIPELQAKTESQPMRVVHVYTIDDDSCYGGCHEMFRKIDYKMRHDMDYERCHACSDRIKHPKGQLFDGGHNSSRMPYYSAI